MARRSTEDVLRRLHRLVAAGQDDQQFREAAGAILGPALRLDVTAWSTTDPATGLLTSCHVVGLPYDASRERTVFRYEYEVDDPVAPHYADLARAPVPAAALNIATGGEPESSVRYREVLAPLDLVDDLRIALVAGGVPWGTVTAYRRSGAPPFDEEDVRLAAAAAPVLTVGIRRGLLQRACADPEAAAVVPDPPGALVVDGASALVVTTPAGERWLDEIGSEGRLPGVVAALVAALRAEAGAAELEVVVPSRNGGWVGVHASRAKGAPDDHVAFVLERARGPVLADHVARVHGLTDREREVARLAVQGLSNKEMATVTGTSPFTVNDHLKAVFAKVGVTSRGQLAARLLDLHYLPRVQAGRSPGPYGWFLEPPPLVTEPDAPPDQPPRNHSKASSMMSPGISWPPSNSR